MLCPYSENSADKRVIPVPSAELSQVEAVFEQGSGNFNEDAQLITDGLYGVFDGATSLSGTLYDGVTGGFLASNIAADVFADRNLSLTERMVAANEAIHSKMLSSGVDLTRKEEHWTTSLAVIEMDGDQFHWCQTGDCRIQLIGHDGTSRQLVEPEDHDAETLSLWQKIGPASSEPIGVALAEQILHVRRRMNVDYGVLNGENDALHFVSSGSETLDGVAAIILYTDGLVLPNYDLNLPHDQDLLATIFQQGGLSAVRDRVRSLQQDDPRCLAYPRFKMNDDISGIALS
ncbi:protein phosphatase 2C domain-containing protein [Desulfosediminicola ganghwensis]|uniref:protein phosphatase 2C domain-containing protein n=1 Tax=Desulfosediminicola ganghwensis TaxID=2569540 RepID=UPI0010AD68B9|nr:protein phosphatase 2C domain-containing protein [Desulfosediminicola ganghwensis]